MIQYLKDDTKPSSKQYKDICNAVNKFLLSEDREETLLQKISTDNISYLAYQFQIDFLKHIHVKYSHLEYSELLEIIQF